MYFSYIITLNHMNYPLLAFFMIFRYSKNGIEEDFNIGNRSMEVIQCFVHLALFYWPRIMKMNGGLCDSSTRETVCAGFGRNRRMY